MKGTDPDSVVTPQAYYGLKAIAKRMGWTPFRVKNMAVKWHFPLVRMPAMRSRGWSYYTDEDLILAWYSGLIQNTRRYLVERKGRGTDKLRERQEPQGLPWQVAHNTEQACPQEVSCNQSPLGTSDELVTNTNETNDLAVGPKVGGRV